MKKSLTFAALAVILAACTNEKDVLDTAQQPQEIAMKTITYKASRAAVKDARVPIQTTIYVNAWHKDGSAYTSYLSNAAFTNPSKNEQNTWSGGYFYPSGGTLDIMAFASDSLSDYVAPKAVLNGDVANQRIQNLVLDYKNSTKKLEGKTDVMWSEIFQPTKDANGKYTPFTLPFHHALSWVVVNFSKVSSETSDDAIKIRNVKLNGVALTGILTVTPTYDAAGAITKYTPAWTETTTVESVDFPAFAGKELEFGTAADMTALGLMIIPGSQTSISFQYCSKNGASTATGDPEYTSWSDYTINLSATDLWKAEKKYVYNVSIATNEISFYTSVTTWSEKEDDGTTPTGADVTI